MNGYSRRMSCDRIVIGVTAAVLTLNQGCIPEIGSILPTLPVERPAVTIVVNPSGGGIYSGSDGTRLFEGTTAVLQAVCQNWTTGTVTYAWTQIGGPAVTLRGANTESCSFVAPNVDQDSEITLTVTATNEAGSGTATAVITVLDAATHIPPPVAEITVEIENAWSYSNSNNAADVDEIVTLRGSAHPQSPPPGSEYAYYDPSLYNDYVSYSYYWRKIAGPEEVALTAYNVQAPSFVAPALATAQAVTFCLTVTDGQGRQASATASVNILDVPAAKAEASAGPYRYCYPYWIGCGCAPIYDAYSGETVELLNIEYPDITFDQRGPYSQIAVQWTQKSGPPVEIRNADELYAHFVAPCVGQIETAVFTVTVTDRLGRQDSSDTEVKLHPVAPPTAEAGWDQTFTDYYDSGSDSSSLGVPETVSLQGFGQTGFTWIDTDRPAFQWAQVHGPATIELQDADRAEAFFVVPRRDGVPVYGDYVFRLTVTDRCGTTATSLTTVHLTKVVY